MSRERIQISLPPFSDLYKLPSSNALEHFAASIVERAKLLLQLLDEPSSSDVVTKNGPSSSNDPAANESCSKADKGKEKLEGSLETDKSSKSQASCLVFRLLCSILEDDYKNGEFSRVGKNNFEWMLTVTHLLADLSHTSECNDVCSGMNQVHENHPLKLIAENNEFSIIFVAGINCIAKEVVGLVGTNIDSNSSEMAIAHLCDAISYCLYELGRIRALLSSEESVKVVEDAMDHFFEWANLAVQANRTT